MTSWRDPAQSRGRLLWWVAPWVVCLACGTDGTSEEAPRIVSLEASIDGRLWVADEASRSYLLDTGTPRTLLSPEVLGLSADTFEERAVSVADWRDPAGLNNGTTPLVVVHPSAFLEADGVIGMDLLAGHSLSWLAPSSLAIAPVGFLPEYGRPRAELPLALVGGGRTCFGSGRCIDFGPTRAVFKIRVEGVEVDALLDTGARHLVITGDLYEQLSRDDRPSLQIDVAGGERTRLSRVDEVTLGPLGLEQVVTQVLDVTPSVERLRIETGRRIQAFVGTRPLRQFWPTIDPNAGRLSLAVGDEATHGVGNSTGLGFDVRLEPGCVRVVLLARGLSPERNGLRLNDCVTRVQTSSADPEEIERTIQNAVVAPIGSVFRTWVAREGGEIQIDAEVESFLPPIPESEAQVHF